MNALLESARSLRRDKILSVHEADLHVIVRAKAGKEVDFGNTLFIAEN